MPQFVRPKTAFLSGDDIIFHFEHEKDASAFAHGISEYRVGHLSKQNVHVQKPQNLRHVRVYLGKGVLGFIFNHQEDAAKFFKLIHGKGAEDHVCKDGSWRVFVPSLPK